MDTGVVIERVQRVAAARVDVSADRTGIEAGLRDVSAIRAWCDASEADLVRQLAEVVSFPEAVITDATHDSTTNAAKTIERSKTLDAAVDLASALDDGAITAGHVDAVTRAAGGLDAGQREALIERCDRLSTFASHATVDQWRTKVRQVACDVQRADGLDRLERQKRATTVSTWVDGEGMWNLRGRFDPLTGVTLATRLDHTVDTVFADTVPATAPADPIERNKHLRALALARLITGDKPTPRAGRPEFVVVIDTTSDTNTTGAPGTTSDEPDWDVTWPIPIDIPLRILRQMMNEPDANVHTVIVRNGIVLHAPGELDLGRTTRLANTAQRRALRALYSTCTVPGCRVPYDRCKLHHITWWRNGGTTDLSNLAPLCTTHHTNIHHDGWTITLGPNRELRLELPDGTIMTTGPPNRRAA